MARDYVRVTLRRKTVEELVNACVIALGDTDYDKGKGKGKGKGKKKDGGGDVYPKPEGKDDTAGKTKGEVKTATNPPKKGGGKGGKKSKK